MVVEKPIESGEVEARVQVAAREVVAVIGQRLNANNGRRLLVTLDGGSGAGKSVVAKFIAAQIDATIVTGDDFCYAYRAPDEWAIFTPAERAAGIIDWQRMRTQALEPLLAGQVAIYRPCDFVNFGSGLSAEFVTCQPARVILLDGIYSARPELADLVGLTVLVDAPHEARYRRHDEREGGDESAWHALWDSAEDHYFTHIRPPATFDLIVNNLDD
jgi:uridine kinase